jgi:hypothetical protein
MGQSRRTDVAGEPVTKPPAKESYSSGATQWSGWYPAFTGPLTEMNPSARCQVGTDITQDSLLLLKGRPELSGDV